MRRVLGGCVVALLTALVLIQPAGGARVGWRKLHRPLHLPQIAQGVACPVTSVDSRIDWASLHIHGGSGIGRGPAYPATGPTAQLTVQTDTQHGGPWLTTKLFWYVRPRYRGPVLIRGRQLDGTHRGWASTAARFRAGSSVSTSARRSDGPVSRRTREACRPTSAHSFRVVTASRIDGTRFSRIVIFRVTD